MERVDWPTKHLSVATLLLDEKNPRLGKETEGRVPREIVQYLFDHDKALDVARSIVTRGYFANEPLLAISDGRHYVVVEGNRRLAALKALKEPGLLSGSSGRAIERLARQADLEAISKVPVIIAPDRRATDRLLAGRHVGTPVLAWRAENRANFILSKLEEGYSNDELRDELGFTLQDIQKARQTRAIAEITRVLDLPAEIKARIENPRVKLFSTLERIFESSVGRKFLKVELDADHGFRGTTTKTQFLRAFERLVTDIVLGKETSRTLNTNDNIRNYFVRRNRKAIAISKRGRFIPADIFQGRRSSQPKKAPPKKKARKIGQTVLPKNFKVRVGNDRLIDIRGELTKIKREQFPNAGAVLLRVFLELSVRDYLGRTGQLKELAAKLKAKGKLPPNRVPTMKQMTQEITSVAKKQLSKTEATLVEKALRYDSGAPFTISDLHAFVHSTDFPGERDLLQFWKRTEPLFRLMLEQDLE